MGKAGQGVFSWWLLSHHFGHPPSYIGFDGSERQVRALFIIVYIFPDHHLCRGNYRKA